MISDAFTARVLGFMAIAFVLIIDASMVIFSRAPGAPIFPFALYVSLPSLPFLIGGAVLIARSKRYGEGD